MVNKDYKVESYKVVNHRRLALWCIPVDPHVGFLDYDSLNQYEKANIDFIKKLEENAK